MFPQLRPVTAVTRISRPMKTPLCGSRKSCEFSCEFPISISSIPLSFTARLPAYSRQLRQLRQPRQPAFSSSGLDQLGCTSLFSRASSGTVRQQYWSFTSLSRASCRPFSSSANYPTMAATRLDGTAIAKKIRERLAAEIVEKQKSNPKYQPCLKIIQGWCFKYHSYYLLSYLVGY